MLSGSNSDSLLATAPRIWPWFPREGSSPDSDDSSGGHSLYVVLEVWGFGGWRKYQGTSGKWESNMEVHTTWEGTIRREERKQNLLGEKFKSIFGWLQSLSKTIRKLYHVEVILKDIKHYYLSLLPLRTPKTICRAQGKIKYNSKLATRSMCQQDK